MILRRAGYHTTKKRSQKSEKDLADKIGGKVQPASGAINRRDLKGDVTTVEFHCDDKLCGGKSFSITLAFWKKLSNEAWKTDKRPLIRINFEKGEPIYVMDEICFLELLRKARKHDEK